MIRKTLAALGGLILLILLVSVVFGVTASYNTTVRIVNSAGTVINGVASATTALYNSTVRVVDSSGNVIDSFGGGAGGSHVTSPIAGDGSIATPLTCTTCVVGASNSQFVQTIDASKAAGADNAIKINAAITTLSTAGGIVDATSLSSGSTSTTITIPANVRIRWGNWSLSSSANPAIQITGDNAGLDCQNVQSSNNPAVIYTPSSGTALNTSGGPFYFNYIVGCHFQGTAGTGTAVGVDFTGMNQLHFSQNKIRDFFYNLKCNDTSGSGSNTLNNFFENSELRSSSSGGWNDTTTNLAIDGVCNANEFHGMTGYRAGYGIKLGTVNATQTGEANFFYNFDIESAQQAAIQIARGTNATFREPHFESDQVGWETGIEDGSVTTATGISESGNTVSVTTTATYLVGSWIVLKAFVPVAYNGTYQVLTSNGTTTTFYTPKTAIGAVTTEGTSQNLDIPDKTVAELRFDCPYYANSNLTQYVSQAAGTVIQPCGQSFVSDNLGLGPQPGNLIPNARFDGWKTASIANGWNGISGTTWTTTGQVAQQAVSGLTYATPPAIWGPIGVGATYAAECGNGTNTGRGCAEQKLIPIDPTRTYTLSYLAGGVDTTVAMRPAIRLLKSDGSTLVNTSFTVADSQLLNGTTGTATQVETVVGNNAWAESGTYNAWIFGGNQAFPAANVLYPFAWSLHFPPTAAYAQVGFAITVAGGAYIFISDVNFSEGQTPYLATYRSLPDSGSPIEVYSNAQFDGTMALLGSTSGTATLQVPAAAGTPAVILPTVNTTGPATQAATTGQVLSSTTAGVQSYISTPIHLVWGPATFGNTSAPDFVQHSWRGAVAPANGCHVTNLNCINNYHAATCTTAPSFNVFNGTDSTEGTALTCSTSAQSTPGTWSNQAETLVITGGNVYGIELSTIGGTCLTDIFTVSADLLCP